MTDCNQDASDTRVLVQDDAHIFCRESQVSWIFWFCPGFIIPVKILFDHLLNFTD